MTVQTALQQGCRLLEEANIPVPRLTAEVLLCHALDCERSRLYDRMLQEQQAKIAAERKGQIGSGDRSEKIRTYNFPQDRITDHRIGLTLHQLDLVMDGRLDPIIDALTAHTQDKGAVAA